MCTVLLPPGVKPIAVKCICKYINKTSVTIAPLQTCCRSTSVVRHHYLPIKYAGSVRVCSLQLNFALVFLYSCSLQFIRIAFGPYLPHGRPVLLCPVNLCIRISRPPSNATTCPLWTSWSPSRLWPKCTRLLRLGRPWGAVTLSRWGGRWYMNMRYQEGS
jgi:hypothetical protein